MNKIVFDLETTGLPKYESKSFNSYYNPSDYHKYDSSRVIQLGYIVLNEKNEIIAKKCFIVKPTFGIENAHIHGITEKQANEQGLELDIVLNEFYKDVKNCGLLISHNLMFDKNVLLSEVYRRGFDLLKDKILSIDTYCTMLNGKNILKLIKYPKLIELVKLVDSNDNWIQKHDAMDDCEKCLKCYLKLMYK